MNYQIVKLEEFQGRKATIYSIMMEEDQDDGITLFDHFLNENQNDYKDELKSILLRLEQINVTTGARENFFKTGEGIPGDGVCALYDDPDTKLRLYCIRYGNVAIILGGGGPKPPDIRKWQDDEKLKFEAETIIEISKDIQKRIIAGELRWSQDGYQLIEEE